MVALVVYFVWSDRQRDAVNATEKAELHAFIRTTLADLAKDQIRVMARIDEHLRKQEHGGTNGGR